MLAHLASLFCCSVQLAVVLGLRGGGRAGLSLLLLDFGGLGLIYEVASIVLPTHCHVFVHG